LIQKGAGQTERYFKRFASILESLHAGEEEFGGGEIALIGYSVKYAAV
jgi:hypothetical protein